MQNVPVLAALALSPAAAPLVGVAGPPVPEGTVAAAFLAFVGGEGPGDAVKPDPPPAEPVILTKLPRSCLAEDGGEDSAADTAPEVPFLAAQMAALTAAPALRPAEPSATGGAAPVLQADGAAIAAAPRIPLPPAQGAFAGGTPVACAAVEGLPSPTAHSGMVSGMVLGDDEEPSLTAAPPLPGRFPSETVPALASRGDSAGTAAGADDGPPDSLPVPQPGAILPDRRGLRPSWPGVSTGNALPAGGADPVSGAAAGSRRPPSSDAPGAGASRVPADPPRMSERPGVLADPADLPGAAGVPRLTRAVAPVLPVPRAVSAAELAVLSASVAPESAIPTSSLPAAFGADRPDSSADPSGMASPSVSSAVPVPEMGETQAERLAPTMARRRVPPIAPGKPTPHANAVPQAGPRDHARDALPKATPEDRAAAPATPPEPRPTRRDKPVIPAGPEMRPVPIAGFAPPEGPLPHGPESKVQPAGGHPTEPAVPARDPAQVLGQVTGALQQARAGITELRLSPEDLGAVRIDLATEGDRASLVISAERQDTLDLMRRNADRLAGDLRAAGFQQLDLSFGRWSGQGQGAPTPHLPNIDPPPARAPAPTLAAERPVSPLGSATVPGRGLYLRI